MTDEQLDAMLRGLEFHDAPDQAFVTSSSEALLGAVRRARTRDASRIGRVARELQRTLERPGRALASPTTRAIGFLILVVLALVAGLLVAGALRQPGPLGNGPLLVSVRGELEVVDPATGAMSSLVPAGTHAEGVSRSPDSRVATFWTTGTGRDHLYAVDVDGGSPRELARGMSMTWDASIDTWSSDSRSLATEVTLDGTARILIVDISSGAARAVTPPEVIARNPLWSPDGRWIAFTPELGGRRGLSIIRTDGTDLHDVAGDLGGLAVAGPDTWSPDGRWIYFSADSPVESHVFRANVLDGVSQQLTGDDLRAYATASSPDGSTIAFIVDAHYGFDLWVAASDGSNAHRILESAGLGGWSTDGAFILVRWKPQDDTLGGLGTIRPDGTDFRILVPFDPGCRHGWEEGCVLGFGWGQARP